MTEEEVKQGELEEKKEEQVPEKVELSPEQYAALLDQIEEYKEKASRKILSIDELADEARVKRPPKEEQIKKVELAKDIEELTKKELVEYIFQVADASITPALQGLQNKIEELRVFREIDKLEQDPEYKDFWDHKDAIWKVASENPNLSLQDAYHLATGKPKQKKEAPKGEEKKATLLTLPPRPIFGERPGHSTTAAKEVVTGKTVKEAANKAWDDIVGGKTTIT